LFKQAQKKRYLELELMNGGRLVTEPVTWGKYSYLVTVVDGSDLTDHFDGGRECVQKHAVARMRLGEAMPQADPQAGAEEEE
jgi:hypothetical protein